MMYLRVHFVANQLKKGVLRTREPLELRVPADLRGPSDLRWPSIQGLPSVQGFPSMPKSQHGQFPLPSLNYNHCNFMAEFVAGHYWYAKILRAVPGGHVRQVPSNICRLLNNFIQCSGMIAVPFKLPTNEICSGPTVN